MRKFFSSILIFFFFSPSVIAQIDRLTEAAPGPLIYEGIKAEPHEFPESGWIQFCTATLVAPTVVLTAGHCVDTGEHIKFDHRQSAQVFDGVCTRHPAYNDRTVYNDYAFCKLSQAVPADSHLASISLDQPRANQIVLMQGYGRPNLVNLYYARAPILTIRRQDVITCDKANLGAGDSGGALFADTATLDKSEIREIIGVNSRASSVCSYFNRTSHGQFVSFAKQYERANNVKLCGVGIDCRRESDCKHIYRELEKCIGLGSSQCLDLYEEFFYCLEGPDDFGFL